jgi:hypothetical protein
MEKVQIAVRLITPDPAAVTALNAVKAMRLQMPPIRIHRYDLWEFEAAEGGKKTISEVVGHFTDIVNPNKQTWTFAEEGTVLTAEDPELQWVGIIVRDYEDSMSGNWTDLLKRRGFAVDYVRWGVLWRLGYLNNTDEALARKMAMDLAVSQTRTGGLFSNPVSQEVSFWT